MDLEKENFFKRHRVKNLRFAIKVLRVDRCHYIEGPRGFKTLKKKYSYFKFIQNTEDKHKNKIKNNLDLKILKDFKLVSKKFSKLKILGTGEIKKNLEITAHFASKQALIKIEKAGGKLNISKK